MPTSTQPPSSEHESAGGAVPWEAGGISGKLQDPRGGQVSREGASNPPAWVASAALSLLRSRSLEAATGKKTKPFSIYFSCELCFKCYPEWPFEAARAASDLSLQLINTCRQP